MTNPAPQDERRTRVAAVVLNSVSRDARVLKEADSLARAGYEVTVFGIRDNRDATPETVRESGARIVRVAWKADSYRMLARVLLFASALATLVMVALAILAAGPVTRVLVAAADRLLVEPVIAGALVLAGASTWSVLSGTARRFRRSAAILDAQNDVGSGPKLAGRRRWRPGASLGPTLAAIRHRMPARLNRRAIRIFLARRFGRVTLERELKKAMVAFNPTVVHCHDLPTVPIGLRVKRVTGAKVVYDAHEIYEEVSLLADWRRRRYRRLQRRVSGHVDAFITVNDSIHEFMRATYPRLPDGEVVCNAVLRPQSPPQDDGRLRRAAEVADGQRILLYQGGFARHRGLDVLVRSAPLLPPDWTLVMMGWGAFEGELRRVAQEVDPGGSRVRFIPGAPHAELRDWTAGADLGVIPYENVCLNHWFCSPNKLWEYPTAGVPILASPYPVLSEIVIGNGIGLLLDDPATPEGIARSVGGASARDLAAMREACMAFIAKDNWDRYEQRLLTVYEEMAEDRTRITKVGKAARR